MLILMQKTRLISIVTVLILISVFFITGCAPSGGQDSAGEQKTGQQVRVVRDYLDRDVEVPLEVKRIATLYAYTGYVTTMLGRGQDIVAINNGLSRDVLLNMVCPGIGENPIPFSSSSINIEELLKAEPDLVFIKGDVGTNAAEVEKLNKFNIPYVVIDCNNIEEQMRSIEIMGEVLGCQEQARKYNEYFQQCIDRVQTVVKNIPEEQRVRVFHSINEASRTDVANTLPADWMEKTGVINVSLDKDLRLVEGKYFASLEQILLWDPDVIIANEAGVADYILTNPQWAPLKAVQNQKVYQMPIGISRWGHPGGLETPLAILWTAKTVYPEYFSDLDIEAEAKTFYQEFFNYEVSDELIQQILAAADMRQVKNERPQE